MTSLYEIKLAEIKEKHYGFYKKNLPILFHTLHDEHKDWSNKQLREKITKDLEGEISPQTIRTGTPEEFKDKEHDHGEEIKKANEQKKVLEQSEQDPSRIVLEQLEAHSPRKPIAMLTNGSIAPSIDDKPKQKKQQQQRICPCCNQPIIDSGQ